MTKKTCRTCVKIKSYSGFHVDSKRVDGRAMECKECTKIRSATYYKNNRDEINKRAAIWRIANPERNRKLQQAWYENNKEKHTKTTKKWRKENREKVNGYDKKWRDKNPEKRAKAVQNWAKKNKEKVLECGRKSNAKRRSTPMGALNSQISTAICRSLKGNKDGRRWESIVGYSLQQLKLHLEKQFLSGMSWDNRSLWHIDHRIPKRAFNFEKPEDEDFKRCWALENLQPLWAEDNCHKQARLEKPFQPSLIFTNQPHKPIPAL